MVGTQHRRGVGKLGGPGQDLVVMAREGQGDEIGAAQAMSCQQMSGTGRPTDELIDTQRHTGKSGRGDGPEVGIEIRFGVDLESGSRSQRQLRHGERGYRGAALDDPTAPQSRSPPGPSLSPAGSIRVVDGSYEQP